MSETTKPRYIYLVRHGESVGNIGTTVQVPEEPLSARGREQAAFVGKRLAADVQLDHVLVSTMARTRETADIILKQINWQKEVEYSDLLIEKLHPTKFFGVERESDAFQKYYKESAENWHDPNWRHSDEENFFILKGRAAQALLYIESLPHTHTLVVTHGLFLRFLMGVMMFKDDFSPRDSGVFIHALRTQNTGITVAEYDPNNHNKGWIVLTFNDYAHLPK